MVATKSQPRGRRKKEGELASVRHEIKFKPSEYARLEEIEQETGVQIGTLVKRVLFENLDRQEREEEEQSPAALLPSMGAMLAEAAQSGELSEVLGNFGLRLPVLGSAPCGPIREVVAETNASHTISPPTAEWLEAQPRDYFIVCDGQSMEGAGIPNGALLLLRPLPEGGRPQSGEVALVQLFDDEGKCFSTIKRWMNSHPLELHDGEGKAIDLPANLDKAVPVAVARGIVSRYK